MSTLSSFSLYIYSLYTNILIETPAIRDVRTVIDKLFIHLAKRSGMCDRDDFLRKIDLKGKALDTIPGIQVTPAFIKALRSLAGRERLTRAFADDIGKYELFSKH